MKKSSMFTQIAYGLIILVDILHREKRYREEQYRRKFFTKKFGDIGKFVDIGTFGNMGTEMIFFVKK